ncbi:MAG: tRNA lysidine(34) synthetase TilS [Planctomycetes bacterium]|nr:tRNA lysidine(34) synthetase TilS [Planctomycetota bacterium]
MATVGSYLDRFEKSLIQLAGPRISQPFLIAASGGPDSTALLRLFQLWRDRQPPPRGIPRLLAGHVHHGLRGGEAEADAEFVRELAERHGMEFLLEKAAVRRLAEKEKRSLEWAGREARYRALERWARQHGAGGVATGHNRDDQAETILFRLVRGTGLKGLAGILPRRFLGPPADPSTPLLIRPLLDWSREEILAFLEQLGQPCREDRSNQDLSIPRNALRRQILPLLEAAVHGGARKSLCRLSRTAHRSWRLLEELCHEKWAGLRRPGADGPESLALSSTGFKLLSSSLKRQLLRLGLEELARKIGRPAPALSLDQTLEALRRAAGIRTGWDRVPLGGGWAVEIGDEILSFTHTGREAGCRRERPAAGAEAPALPLLVPGTVEWQSWRISIELSGQAPAIPTGSRWIEVVDADRLSPPLEVRGRRAGDRFHPLGASGSQKLKEFFRAAGLALQARGRIPLVFSGAELAWVVGFRIGHRFRVTEKTARWAVLKAEPPAGWSQR